jgi:NAD(P)-dependent dehydrogenase (short-subunit alcohol dehydrogenase family)
MENQSLLLVKEKAALCAPAVRMLLGQGAGAIVTAVYDGDAAPLLRSQESFSAEERLFSNYTNGNLTGALFVAGADDMEALYANLQAAVDACRKKAGHVPAVVAIQNIGLFAGATTKADADAVLRDFFAAVKSGKPASAPGEQVPARPAATGRVAGKIAVITGSAQGFGKGIAEEMAREGAYIVVADVNEPLAKEFAAELCRTYGSGKALAVGVDVTQEESIKNLMAETTLAYGGIDAFISNAGILKAGSLEEMDVKSFDLVTKINYTAYFVGTKHAARYMKVQHRFDKGYFGDIIQINSKSGLEGSNKNFAYAGGKFGGIGLTQSFALELVDYNIKVNAVCPGNFFEGPLWADPKNGLFAQYLRANKVPGAKTIADVKHFYESKVPMKRGCSPRDVALAVFYIMEQRYETGQAVPVTGGQVMLN